MTSADLVLVPVAAICSACATGMVRRLALHLDLMDLPGARSSHLLPTPRGGGLAVIAVAVPGIALMSGRASATPMLGAALLGVLFVATVGWMDDRSSLSPGLRLGAHVIAAVCMALFAASLPGPLGVVGGPAILWWIFWSVAAVNVTNFMDGIDGLAASQAAIFGVHVALLAPRGSASAGAASVLAGACLGFLLWNWPPARIFLGDVGSGALGLLLVLCGIMGMRDSGWSTERVFLPLFPFFLDASVTLVRRMIRGERVWEAHREHLYQRLARGSLGHLRVTVLFAVLAATGALVAHVRGGLQVLAMTSYMVLVIAIGIGMERCLAAILRDARQGSSP